jgi:hypothetical protein
VTPELPPWRELQNEFLQHAVEHTGLRAVWTWVCTFADRSARRSPQGKWIFSGGLPASQQLFRALAGRAAAHLPGLSNNEPWRLWLDALRSEGYARKMRPKIVPWRQFKLAAEAAPPLPPGHEYEEIESVFKSSADFCLVHSLAEVRHLSSPRAANDTRGDSAQVGADGPRKVSAADAGTEVVVPPPLVRQPSNPFPENDSRHESWATFVTEAPKRLKSAVDDVAHDNEHVNRALTALLKAATPERRQHWEAVLPTLHRRRPLVEWPGIAPLDDNKGIEILLSALEDAEQAVLRRLATLAGEALRQFVRDEKDIGPFVEMVRYIAESALAAVPSPSERFRDQISAQQNRWEDDARELAVSAATVHVVADGPPEAVPVTACVPSDNCEPAAETLNGGGTEERHAAHMRAVAERAARRQAVVNPALKLKRWKIGRLVTESGVGKATVYGYMNGMRSWIKKENRDAICQCLDLEVDNLPE